MMTDAAPSTDQPAESVQPVEAAAATAEVDTVPAVELVHTADAEPETEDTRTARQKILDHFQDTEGAQTAAQIMAGTGLNRNLTDSTLSRAVDAGLIERVGQGLYRRVPPKAKPELPSTFEQAEWADGRALDEWLGWLRSWDQGNPWRGPGDAPDQDGSLVALDVLIRWRAEKNVKAEQQAQDLVLLERLLDATGGNFVRSDALADLRAIKLMIASDIARRPDRLGDPDLVRGRRPHDRFPVRPVRARSRRSCSACPRPSPGRAMAGKSGHRERTGSLPGAARRPYR
jgi:hypothetical protein